MARELHDIGDVRRLPITFTNNAGSSADPSTVIFRMREPDDTVTAYTYGVDAELIKTDTGDYYVDWPFTQAGRHVYRWEGTGTGGATTETEIIIQPRNVAAS